VAAGDQVVAAQAIAALDDGGTAAAALRLAQNELAAAELELDQKRTNDPARGAPATPAENAATQLAVDQAQQRLAQLTGAPDPADVTAAQLELAKAHAELEAATRPASATSLDAAQLAVDAARRKLAQVNEPASPLEVAGARLDVAKAQSDLDDLQQSPSPSQPALDAARLALDVATLKLAQMTGPPNANDVTTAQAEVAKAVAELDAIQRGPSAEAVATGRLGVTLAEQRLAQVLHPGAIVLDPARLDVAKALADLDVLRQRSGPANPTDVALARLKAALATDRVAQANAQVERLTVRARAAGVVTAVLTAAGSPADPTSPIATVADVDRLSVIVDLSEFDAAAVKRGQPAMVSVDALGGKRLAGTVLLEPLTGVDNGGVVTFPVRVGLSDSAGVKPGMGVSVRIVVAERRGVVRVPLEAVSGAGDRAAVTVMGASGTKTRRHLMAGLADNKRVEVRSGLHSGERVLLRGGPGA